MRISDWSSDVCSSDLLAGDERLGIRAVPGEGSHVPLWILGSSLFGAQLAAALGLPYAFASHFAPDALDEALDIYRRQFKPSEDRKSVVSGKSVSVRVDLGGRRIIKKKNKNTKSTK